MADALNTAFLFLISTIFDIYIFLLLARLILVYARSNYFDPFTQFIVKMTDVVVRPTRRYIPNWKQIETSTLCIVIILEVIKFFIICALTFGIPNLFGVLIIGIADVIKSILQILFYAIILQAILTWVQPYSPFIQVLSRVTSPIMKPLRRYIPLVGGFDITPIPALIILQLLIMLIASPLMALGLSIAAG